jgi:hypothetical protein
VETLVVGSTCCDCLVWLGRERGFTTRLFPARLSFPIERGTHSEDDVRSFSERQSDERREKRRCDVIVVPGVGQAVESAGLIPSAA